jgi:hypothetical protein
VTAQESAHRSRCPVTVEVVAVGHKEYRAETLAIAVGHYCARPTECA